MFEFGGILCPYEEPIAHCESVGEPASFCAEDLYVGPGDDPQHPLMILPGTSDVEVQLGWSAGGSTASRVGVGFQANHLEANTYGEINWTMMYPRASGQSTHIATSPEMTDHGHQAYSTWRFRFYLADYASAKTFANPLAITIKIHKGTLPLEPAHRNFWGPNQTMTLIDHVAVSSGLLSAYPSQYDGHWTFPSLVPPETKTIDFILEQDTAGNPERAWGILYKTAELPPQPSGDFSKYRKLTDPQTSGLARTFHLSPTPLQNDRYYSKVSDWDLALDDGVEPVEGQGVRVEPYALATVTFTLTVVVHKDPDAAPVP